MTDLKPIAKTLTMNMKRALGFTLIELVVTMTVGAILLSAAVPAFQDLMRNNRLTAQANSMVAAIQLARSEALKRRVKIYVSATDEADWAKGWEVWADLDDDADQDDGEKLRIVEALDGGNSLVDSDGVVAMRFEADGTATDEYELALCHSSDTPGRQITVNRIGRITTDSNYDCP